MKKSVAIVFIVFSLFSCGKSSEDLTSGSGAKMDYVIQVRPFDSFGSGSLLEKSGKIQGKDDIKLSSQAVGRIGEIYVKEGDKVIAGQLLVSLDDTVANYGINIEKANNLIDRLYINYDSTKLALDKQVFDLEIALEKLNNNLLTLKSTSSIDISQAQDNLSNTDYGNMDTKSALDLQKLDNSIAKAELDYSNALTNNEETIEGFKNNIAKEQVTQKLFLDDIISFGDKLFDISGLYKDDVKKINDFFGTKDSSLKTRTREMLLGLSDIRKNKLAYIEFDTMSNEDILSYIEVLEKNYSSIEEFLTSLEKTLNNSVVSVGQFSQSQIDGYVASTNAYQSQYSINNGSFTAFKNGTNSFLRTYQNTEKSLASQLDILKKDRNIFVKNYDLSMTQSKNTLDKIVSGSEDTILGLELQLRQTEESLNNAKKSRDLTLQGIDNSIKDAYIGKSLVEKEYSKLEIRASIDGVIGDIFVDKGQDVSMGVPLLSIISDSASEAELYFKESELSMIAVGDPVYANMGGKSLTGSLYSISSVSDDSLNYKVLAIFGEKIQNLGGVVTVTIPVKTDLFLLPLEYVEVVGTSKGIIGIYKDELIVKKEIVLGKMYKDSVEFLRFSDGMMLDPKINLIVSDVSNYDSSKFQIKLAQ